MEGAVSVSNSFTTNQTASFVERYINIMVLFFPVTSFLLVPSIQGTTIVTVLSALIFMVLIFLPFDRKPEILTEIYWFTAIVLILSICSQTSNLVFDIKLSNNLFLINLNQFLDTFYRASHITQTLYLISGFITYLLIKYYSGKSLMNYLFWGIRILCLYAIYEFVFYILTGQNGDFVSNRTMGYEARDASLFQTINFGGISMLRIKGYTGEPSMFTFTVFPFWVLTFGLKRWADNLLLLVCLIFTFSTTAYISMFLFSAFWFIYKRQYKLIIVSVFVFVAIMLILQMEQFKTIVDRVYDTVIGGKLNGESESSKTRSNYMENHLQFWSLLPFSGKIIGIGFGYIRSTDFFSTVILNTGIAGFIAFTVFFLKNLSLKIGNIDLKKCYQASVLLLYFIMMATVPEFSYSSLWIFLGLGFVIEHGGQVC